MADYRSLRAWHVAHQLALEVVRAAERFPRHERFELSSQLRRAALSVATNIVEGQGRFGPREFRRFVGIAAGSCAEVDYLLFFAKEMGYLGAEEYGRLDGLRKHATWVIARLARGLDHAATRPDLVRLRTTVCDPR